MALAFAATGGANLPLYLSWIPTVLMLVLGTGLMAVGRIWDRPLTYLALLGLAILAYTRSLPMISAHFDRHQERLLRM